MSSSADIGRGTVELLVLSYAHCNHLNGTLSDGLVEGLKTLTDGTESFQCIIIDMSSSYYDNDYPVYQSLIPHAAENLQLLALRLSTDQAYYRKSIQLEAQTVQLLIPSITDHDDSRISLTPPPVDLSLCTALCGVRLQIRLDLHDLPWLDGLEILQALPPSAPISFVDIWFKTEVAYIDGKHMEKIFADGRWRLLAKCLKRLKQCREDRMSRMGNGTYVEELQVRAWFSYEANDVTKWWDMSTESQIQVRKMLDGLGVKAVLPVVDGASNLVKIC